MYFFWITHIKERKIKMQDILKKISANFAHRLAISIGMVLIAFIGAWADPTPIDINGTFQECLGSANGRDYRVTNKLSVWIYDFTITIEKQGGGDPGATITDIVGIPGFDVDDNMDGDLNDPGENNDNDSTPGTTTRTQGRDGAAIPPGGSTDMNIRLSGFTNGVWCITIQPTDKTGKGIGKGLTPSYGGSNEYSVTLTDEAAQIAPYTGIAFADSNATGLPFNLLFLDGVGFQILNAYQKDGNGDEIPGSVFNQSNGSLTLARPVMSGDQFDLAVEVDQFFGSVPMTVRVSLQPLTPPCCDVEMMPDNYPINVPPGGSFGLTGRIANPSQSPIVTDVWVGVIYQYTFYQLWYFPNIPLQPGQFATAHLNQNVPGNAPQGTYSYAAYCGDRQTNLVCDLVQFQFTVVGARVESGANDWTLEGGWDASSQTIPSDYSLSNSYPNPFNAKTSIEFGLPEAGEVNLTIYNLLGQRVATPVNGHKEAGQHSVIWDAANHSSGIYFYRLTAGDEVMTKRMTLLK